NGIARSRDPIIRRGAWGSASLAGSGVGGMASTRCPARGECARTNRLFGDRTRGMVRAALVGAFLLGVSAESTRAAITEARVLVIYNSAATDGTTLKNSYLAAHPGIPANHVLDLNDPALAVAQVTYADFIARIRNPIRTYLTSLGAAEIQN